MTFKVKQIACERFAIYEDDKKIYRDRQCHISTESTQ
jgi:hypothetical protein